MAYTDQFELQSNLNSLLNSATFNTQVATAADEIFSALDAQRVKTPPPPAAIVQKAMPVLQIPKLIESVLPKNPIQKAASEVREALSKASEVANRIGNNISNTAQAAANSVRSAVSDAGKNVASTTRAAAASVGSAAKTVGKAIGKIFKSDRRLKTDINLIGQSPTGLNIYEFRFIADPSRKYQGVIADELFNTPYESAVYIDADGYYAVDYNAIDVTFKEVTEM